MSGSIKLKHASGNGVIIAAPSSNPASDRTLTLPSDADGVIAKTDASGNLAVTGDLTVDTDTLKVDSSNNRVGIGTTSPQQLLHIFPDAANTTSSHVRITAGDRGSGTGLDLGHDSSGNCHVNAVSNAHLILSTNNSERVRVINTGNVGIGTTNPSHKLHTTIGAGESNGVAFLNANSQGLNIYTDTSADNADVYVDQGLATASLYFAQAGTKRMAIASSGAARIGSSLTTAAAGKLQVVEESGVSQANNCNGYFETNAANWNLKLYYNNTGTHYHIEFIEQGTQRGTISGSDGSNVTYNQGSDYRWKENIVDLSGSEGIEICKKLKPRKYNWIENREVTGEINTVDGFIAHEVEEAGVLGAVTGVKDAVNEDGSINGQMLDYGQMTPVLAAAIKGLIAKIETLETKVAALEAK